MEGATIGELTRVIEQEHGCCTFLHFPLSIEPDAGPITLDVTGPPGTRQMLGSL